MKQELGNLIAEDPHQETINLLTYRLNAVSTNLAAVTEQRDEAREELADWHNAAEQVKAEYPDEVHCSCVAILRKQLKDVTKQLDSLADLVRQFIYILDITEESDGGRLFHPTNITSCRAGDLQKAGQLVEALRRASRNQPTP